MAQLIATNQLTLTNVNDGIGHLKTWNFYKLSNSTTAPQTVPIGASTNLGHLGPNNAWTPFRELSGGASGFNAIYFDKIAKSDIIPDKPFTWYLEASFDGVSNFNGSTDFNIRFENLYVNSAGSYVYNPLGSRDFTASNFSATNDTSVTNYFSQSITWTVTRAVYDDIPEGGFLNLRIRIDRFTKLFYHAKNSYVTYGTVPSDPTKRGLGNYSTYGWKASPEAVTQSLPYLWIYQIQFYDNGREVAIPPTLIGTQGADGKTPYVHWAYSDNADGTGLTTSDNGQRYIGHYSDYTQADSTDKTKYRWADRLAQADPSDRNLTLNTGYKKKPLGWVQNGVSYEMSGDYLKLKLFDSSGDKRIYREELFTVTLATGDWVNVSYEAYGSKNGIRFRAQTYDTPQIQWKTLTTTPTIYDSAFKLAGSRTLSLFIDGDIGDVVYIRFIKTRKGQVRTPWTPAPEDVEDQISSKADQELTQQQLNLLIENAQLMQTELEARAAMETLSDLERAYNAYVEANDKAVAKSEADLIEAGRRVDGIVETLGGLSKTKTFIETYITEADEGIVIGTNDNVSQIRVTYDRIAMYSAGKEVMYISQGVINIDNGVFTKSLQIGRFRTEQHPTNPDINVCRYLG